MKTNQLLTLSWSGLLVTTLLTGNLFVAETNTTLDETPKKPAAKAVAYTVDTQQSVLNWNAKKVTGEHYGTVNVSKGNLTIDGGKLTGGTVEADMRSIVSTDLKEKPDMHTKLVGHLKSDDFFGVEKHPTATFQFTKVTPKSGNEYDVTGDLTIKGIRNSVTFPATVSMNGNAVEATGKLTVDRTKYDIKFRSKSFFENLGDKAIYDDFTLDMKIVANKAGLVSAK